jgi:hypothetical protein
MDAKPEAMTFASGIDPIQEFLIRERMKNQRPASASSSSKDQQVQQQQPHQQRRALFSEVQGSNSPHPSEPLDEIAALALMGVDNTFDLTVCVRVPVCPCAL